MKRLNEAYLVVLCRDGVAWRKIGAASRRRMRAISYHLQASRLISFRACSKHDDDVGVVVCGIVGCCYTFVVERCCSVGHCCYPLFITGGRMVTVLLIDDSSWMREYQQ